MNYNKIIGSSDLPDSTKSAIKSASKFVDYRKSIYASINGTKGNLVKLSKSRLLSKFEKEKLVEVINKMEELRIIYYNNRGEKQNDEKVDVNLHHLKEDASYLQCSSCGRKTYTGRVNSNCLMIQPNEEECLGIFKNPS